MARRVQQYLEARQHGNSDLDHLEQLNGWRNRYANQMDQYRKNNCYDDDDDDDFRGTRTRGD